MKNSTLAILALLTICLLSCKEQNLAPNTPNTYLFAKDSLAILNVLNTQQSAWNESDIPKFMEGYWKSEELTFIGGRGVTYGWQNTLDNYIKGYPDAAAMGHLTFDIIKVKSLGEEAAQVIGKYTLKRINDQPTGHFSLIFQKIEGQWLLTSDMTANVPTPDK